MPETQIFRNYIFMRSFSPIFLSLSFFIFTMFACKSGGGNSEPQNTELTSVALDKTSAEIVVGDSVVLKVVLSPSNAKNTLTWTSSNEKVATVNNGTIKTLARGTSTITVTSDNHLTATCNVTVTKTDLPYQLVWSDEFDGSTLDASKWNIETGGGGWGNQEKENYTGRADNLRIENGCLVIEAKKETYGSNNYTSARINTYSKASFKYGKVEARISLPSGKGTWPAFWMMGSNYKTVKWPMCGEIDIMEHIGSNPTMVSNALHTNDANGSNGRNWYSRKYFNDLENNFHAYSIEWVEKSNEGDDCISFYCDGVLTGGSWEPHLNSTVKNWPFNKEFFIIMNLAIGGNMGGTVDDAIFDNQILMKVDYVRVYQRK